MSMGHTRAEAEQDSGGHAAIRVMTVDDQPMYRDGLASVLAMHPDLELVAEAGDGTAAVEVFRARRPDVTLMDLIGEQAAMLLRRV
jgi:DNA-binding NarL/FixJ family response regulator